MNEKTFRDRDILAAAQAKGAASTLGAFLRLSGPGWLQSAITLGGGSLAGATYLGMTGGTSLLWVQLLAISAGVIMLSAISYVTLSTGKRPYPAINQYINPVLGVAWITATILANMIFILPQFSLAYDTLETCLMPGIVDGSDHSRIVVSALLAVAALATVFLSLKPGWASKTFDLLLKLIVGAIVLCFVGVVVQLFAQGEIGMDVFWGLIPDLSRLTSPAPQIGSLLAAESISESDREFWRPLLVAFKQEKMIASAAAAVGINMTLLLPYSMLSRGWDKTFLGLARWDLVTGMAIPFVVVTSCIVIATAYSFHGQADDELLSDAPAQVVQSDFFGTAAAQAEKKIENLAIREVDPDPKEYERLLGTGDDKEAKSAFLANYIAEMPVEERKLAVALAKPSTTQLAKSLEPLLGERNANLAFGFGVLAMAFSTIIILMLINGFAFGELFGAYENGTLRIIGSVLALAVGFCWIWLWKGESQTYLAIVASTFAAVLLPIAYLAFFLMMNSQALMGEDKPTGGRRLAWNIAMLVAVALAVAAACISIQAKAASPQGGLVIGGVLTFLLLMLIGFSAKFHNRSGDNASA